MNSAVKSLIARLEREFGGNRQFGRSRLFLFGDSFACSINYSKQLRGEKFFYGLAQDVLDPAFSYPQCRFGEHVVLICETVNQCLVLPRALLLEAMAGVKTGKLDVFLEGGRYILQTTGHPKTDITEFLNAFPSAETSTNATQSEPEEHSREHVGVQGALIQLGRAEGLEVWIPQNDRPSEHEGCRFSELTLNRLPRLGIDEVTRKVVENIDVLWLRRNAIQRAFEIESTTRVYSALLRLNDLILSHPNTQISLHIVAP